MKKQTNLDFKSRVIKLFASLLGKTWRYTVTGSTEYMPSKSEGVIYCSWHENILPASYYYKDSGACTIASRSKDGRRISSILQQWKYTIIKGSFERRGMSVIRQSIQKLKNGANLFITPDGPRGPRRKAKRGVAQIATLSQAPVVPTHIITASAWRLTSWDKFIIPKPFTKIELRLGSPILPEYEDTSDDSIERLTARIQEALTSYPIQENMQ